MLRITVRSNSMIISAPYINNFNAVGGSRAGVIGPKLYLTCIVQHFSVDIFANAHTCSTSTISCQRISSLNCVMSLISIGMDT